MVMSIDADIERTKNIRTFEHAWRQVGEEFRNKTEL